MKHGINILLICPNEHDATSFYRGWGPFGELAKTGQKPIFLHRAQSLSWATLSDKDLIVLQRPCSANDVKVLKLAQEYGVRSWVDWDDMLWGVPPDNPTHSVYHDGKGIQEIVIQCAMNADIVTVSTKALKQDFPPKLQEKVIILTNRLPAARWMKGNPHQKAKEKIWMAWRGSRTHEGDWVPFLEQTERITKEHGIGWRIIGHPSPWVINHLSKASNDTVYHQSELSIEQYFSWFVLNGPQADILFIPLIDSKFNRAKSHIAMIEATFGGMICVGPKWEEWITGIPEADKLLYSSPKEAEQCLQRACDYTRKGAFKTVNRLQEHFRAQADKANKLFQSLVFQEKI